MVIGEVNTNVNSTFSIRWQYGIRSLLMIGLAVYIISLSRTNALHYYLAPHMQKLLLLCPVPLLFIALAMAWHGIVGGGTVRMYVIVSTRCRKAGSKKHSYMECCSFRSYSVLCCPIRHLVVIYCQKGMSFTYPNPDIRRKTDTQTTKASTSSLLSTASSVPTSPPPEGKWSQETLDKLFVPPDKYNAEFAELAKRLYQQPIIQIKPEIFSETIGAIELYKQAFEGKKYR